MSSTNRGAVRSPNDFYVTDPQEIRKFLRAWIATDDQASHFWRQSRRVLDPSAGGLTEEVVIEQKAPKPPLVFKPCEMSYPKAIAEHFGDLPNGGAHQVDTIDIRENSRAAVKADFLAYGAGGLPMDYDVVITNPPFALAIEFIRKAFMCVKDGGYVVMLLRLNFFGSKERNLFFRSGNMPGATYVHAQRLGFTPDGKTDSIEYIHAVWQKTGERCESSQLHVLPY